MNRLKIFSGDVGTCSDFLCTGGIPDGTSCNAGFDSACMVCPKNSDWLSQHSLINESD